MNRAKRNIGPHVGIIKFNIFVHQLTDDGSMTPEVLDCSEEFQTHDISNRGELQIIGFDKWDCIEKIKQKLESLSDNNG
jgi:hypothetical protein